MALNETDKHSILNNRCSNLSNFALGKNLLKFRGCVLKKKYSFLLKAGFKFFVFNFILAAMEFFQINIMVKIGGSDKCVTIVIFSLEILAELFL